MPTQLNESQQKAVMYDKGPLLIVAGAGTGKTTVITHRIEHLIKNKGLTPDNILALTFTDKAANEMVARLDAKMPFGYIEPWVSTFHGFCERILKAEGIEIGLSTDFKILNKSEAWIMLHDNIWDLGLNYYAPLGNPNKFIHEMIKFFSRLQDEDVSEQEFKTLIDKLNKLDDDEANEQAVRYGELLNAYKKYQELKLTHNYMDFGDLITWTLRLFRERKSILNRYREQFKEILVDEFQDTNYAQLQLIKLLAPPENNPNLTVVGDDDQAIYAFRGSSVHNILEFKNEYPTAGEVLLTTNYRSGQPILSAAYETIVLNNPDRLEEILKIDKRLVAARGKKFPKPQIVETLSDEQEADFVVEKILELVGKDYSYQDIAILARAHAHLNVFVSALQRAGIPYQLVGNRGLFDRSEVRDLLFFLRVCSDPYDTTALFYFLHIEQLGITKAELLQMMSESKQRSKALWDIVVAKSASDERYKKIIELVAATQDQDTKLSITELLYRFIHESSYIKNYLQVETVENQLIVKNINLLFDIIKRFDQEHPKASILDAVNYIDLLMEAGENPPQAEIEDVDTVSLLTIHGSKGSEWGVVFLINMVSDRFPSRSKGEVIPLPDEFVKQKLPSGDAFIQEERRLFYVAITRARDYLYLLWGKDYGGARQKRVSSFLKEFKGETSVYEPKAQLTWLSQLGTVEAPKPQRILDGKVELSYVSYSQIDAYKTCPLKYKYQYILQVPSRPHHAFSFGTTIHSVLQRFHLFQMRGMTPSLETLLKMYEELFIDFGYESRQQRDLRFESGKKALQNYYGTFTEKFTGKPKSLEVKFKIMMDGIPLIGRIDRIDEVGNGIELIDYKTGAAKDQKTVDRDAQLTMYAMASRQMFGKLPESLALYFVEDNSKVSTVRTEEQLQKKQNEIIETIEEIRKGKFEASPNFPMPCNYCPYKNICAVAKRG